MVIVVSKKIVGFFLEGREDERVEFKNTLGKTELAVGIELSKNKATFEAEKGLSYDFSKAASGDSDDDSGDDSQ